MAKEQSGEHWERSRIRMGGAFANEPFDEATEVDEAGGQASEAEIASNELHAATGEVCERCGQPIAASADVRKTVKGGYVHEMCPPKLAQV
jgi:hypothetical protein